MVMRVIDLAQQVLEGKATIDELLQTVDSPTRRELVERAAITRTFDRGLYREVLCKNLGDGASPLDFDEFVRSTEIEAVPYSDGRFWVKDSVRIDAIGRWRRDRRDELRALSESIADYLRDPRFEPLAIERLEQLIRCDPDAAAKEFERLYRAADHRFHLSRCSALLELLRAMDTEIAGHKELVRVRQEYRALYQARVLFVNEFHQTVRYLHRPVAERRLRRLLSTKTPANGTTKWIVNLHGPGGVGKTTLLRWLVSHRLVRRRLRVPCVHIDFDAVSLSAVLQFPWLLAIEIAEQLDRQLPQSVFGTMAMSFARFRPLVKADGRLSDDAEQVLRQEATTTDLWPSLISGLGSLPADRAVVIIVDTLEDASLHRPGDLLKVVQNLTALHAASPAVRLVLSGRYALGIEHVPEYCETLRPITRYVRMRRLSTRESRKLILQEWPDVSDEVREALVTRGNGNPLILTPLIELTQPDLHITKDRILGPEFDDLDEAKMIERVIRRIPVRDPNAPIAGAASVGAASTSAAGSTPAAPLSTDHLAVRWVVRYGVIPRRLTQAFVADVLLPFLSRALSGEAEASGDDFIEEIRGQRDWRPEPGLAWKPDTVWQQLTAYATAGNHGWITVDAGEPPTARLHPDVVNPMRRLLRKQRVFDRLQEAARTYFAARGRTVDVLFHSLQLAPARAYDDWHDALTESRYRHDPGTRRQLAEALLTSDFASAPTKAKAYAHWKAAWALASTVNHTLVLPDQIFDLAWRHLEDARKLEAEVQAEDQVVSGITWHCLEVVLLFRGGKRDEAIARLNEALARTDLSDVDRTCLLLHRAEMQVRMARPIDAEASFEQALVCTTRDPHAIIPLWAIHDRLGHRLARRGEWLRSAEHYEAAHRELANTTNESKRDEVFRALVLLDLSMGRPGNAYERLEAAIAPIPEKEQSEKQPWRDLQVRVALALKDPTLATRLAIAMDPRDRPASASGERLTTTSASDVAFLLGEAYAEALDFDLALKEYRRGEALASARGDTAGAERCRVALARMFVRGAGNLDEAIILFDAGAMRSLEQDPTLQAEWLLLHAYVAEHRDMPDKAREWLDAIVGAGTSPHQRVYGQLARLTLKHTVLTNEVVRDLVAQLDMITPATARLSLLEAVELGGRWVIEDGTDTDPLVYAFLQVLDERMRGGTVRLYERRAHVLAMAEILKALGRVEQMQNLLTLSKPPRRDRGTLDIVRRRLVMERQLRRDGVRIGMPPDDLRGVIALLSPDGGSYEGVTPLLFASATIEVADAMLAHGDRDEARRLLDGVDRFFQDIQVKTYYHTRFQELIAELGRAGASIKETDTGVIVGKVRLPKRGAPRRPRSAAPPSSPPSSAESAPVPIPVEPPVPPPSPTSMFAWHVSINASANDYVIERDGEKALVPSVLGFDREKLRYAGRTEAPAIAQSWKQYGRRLADALLALPSARTQQGARVWLSGDPDLLALPWELAPVVEPTRFETLLRVPSINVIGPADRGPQKTPRILILDTRFMQFSESASSSAYSMLPSTLEGIGTPVIVQQRFDSVSTIAKQIQELMPEMIVVVAAFDETYGKEPSIRVGDFLIDSRDLHQAFTTAARPGFLPTVILDVPAPGAPVEAAAQLLARNRFALELLRRGGLNAVLATGLGGDAPTDRLHRTLADGIMAGHPMSRLLAAIRQAGRSNDTQPFESLSDRLHDVLPFFGTALFATSPTAPFVRLVQPT